MSSNIAIKVENLSKCYQIYDQPRDRLKQFLFPRIKRALGLKPNKYFRDFWALKDVSFDVQKGEAVGIVGRNGSGKSTLLQIICGTLSPTSGSVQANGRIAALLELGSGFNPEFTGRENVYLNGSILGLSASEINDRFDGIEAFADIGQFIDQPVKSYSSGMVVRLGFAVAINVDPQILVVDEALAVGDELFQRKCFSRIEAIRSAGATILFVSHSGGTVVELCDRALLLDSGERLAIGTPKKVVGRYQKLIYVPDEKREAVRKEICREDLEESSTTNAKDNSNLGATSQQSLDIQELPDSYDPSLKPTSTISYESYGAVIEDAAIYSNDGEKINNLTRGKSYRYSYKVRFEKTASNVRFGMMLKTKSGIELGGASSASSNRKSISLVTAGNVFTVEFKFTCRLNTGVYFLNAGVVGDLNGDTTYMHRIVDIAMFRVMPETDNLSTGMIDFSCSPYIKLVAN